MKYQILKRPGGARPAGTLERSPARPVAPENQEFSEAQQSTAEDTSLWGDAGQIASWPLKKHWNTPATKRVRYMRLGAFLCLAGAVGSGAFALAGAPSELWFAPIYFGGVAGSLLFLTGLTPEHFAKASTVTQKLVFRLGQGAGIVSAVLLVLAPFTAVLIFSTSLAEANLGQVPFRELILYWMLEIAILAAILALAGSVSAGSYIDSRRHGNNTRRLRATIGLLFTWILIIGALGVAIAFTVEGFTERSVLVSIIVASTLAMLKWQVQRYAVVQTTKNALRTAIRDTIHALDAWVRQPHADNAKADLLRAMDTLSDTLKQGHLDPAGTYLADSGTLMVIEFLQDALPRENIASLYRAKQYQRYPKPLWKYRWLNPAQLRDVAHQFLNETLDHVEGTRLIDKASDGQGPAHL